MAHAFRTGAVDKVYLAAVSPAMRSAQGVLRGVDPDESELRYRLLRVVGETAVLSLRIGTGKKHQVRRTLAAAGHPVVGDARYASSARVPEGCRRDSVMLHAAQLTFEHPVTRETVKVRCEPPWPRAFVPFGFERADAKRPPVVGGLRARAAAAAAPFPELAWVRSGSERAADGAPRDAADAETDDRDACDWAPDPALLRGRAGRASKDPPSDGESGARGAGGG